MDNVFGQLFEAVNERFGDLYDIQLCKRRLLSGSEQVELLRLAKLLCLADKRPQVKVLVSVPLELEGVAWKAADGLNRGGYDDIFGDDLEDMDGRDWEVYWAPLEMAASFVAKVVTLGCEARIIPAEKLEAVR